MYEHPFQGKQPSMLEQFRNWTSNMLDEGGMPSKDLEEIQVTSRMHEGYDFPLVSGFVAKEHSNGNQPYGHEHLPNNLVLYNIKDETNHWDSHLVLYDGNTQRWYYVAYVKGGGAIFVMI